MKGRSIFHSLALLLLGYAGHAAAAGPDGRYPSLSKRPIESRDFDAEARAAEAKAAEGAALADAADPALKAEVEKLATDSQAGAAAFDARLGTAEAAVRAASGSAVSSEAWVSAQVALGDLEGSRDRSVSALAGLDHLYINRLNAIAGGSVAGGDVFIDRYRQQALTTVDAQNDRLDRLKAILKEP